jgi:hypothetical protein
MAGTFALKVVCDPARGLSLFQSILLSLGSHTLSNYRVRLVSGKKKKKPALLIWWFPLSLGLVVYTNKNHVQYIHRTAALSFICVVMKARGWNSNLTLKSSREPASKKPALLIWWFPLSLGLVFPSLLKERSLYSRIMISYVNMTSPATWYYNS